MRTDTGRRQSKIGMTKEPYEPIDLKALYEKVKKKKELDENFRTVGDDMEILRPDED